jgi:hypothetical protein
MFFKCLRPMPNVKNNNFRPCERLRQGIPWLYCYYGQPVRPQKR